MLISRTELSHRYHKISANPILDAWRSGSACDSSNRDIHKVIRSNRVAFIDLAIHDCSHPFAFAQLEYLVYFERVRQRQLCEWSDYTFGT
jgi:hypothetical protein